MTLQQALKAFEKAVDKRPIGYWFDGSNYVFNTDPVDKDLSAPCQYVVEENGMVYATNPMRHPFIIETPMEKLNRNNGITNDAITIRYIQRLLGLFLNAFSKDKLT